MNPYIYAYTINTKPSEDLKEITRRSFHFIPDHLRSSKARAPCTSALGYRGTVLRIRAREILVKDVA